MLRDKSRTAGPARVPDPRVFHALAIISSDDGARSHQALTGARAPVAKHLPEV
jgi:hypothetical protein